MTCCIAVVFVSSFHQANVLVDRRFGEYDEQMTVEEKMLRRFTMEKQVSTAAKDQLVWERFWLVWECRGGTWHRKEKLSYDMG